MKKLMILLTASVFAFAACSEEDKKDSLIPDKVEPTPELTADEQKTKLEDVGKEVAALIPNPTDFSDEIELFQRFEDVYLTEDYDWDALFDHIEAVAEDMWAENQDVKSPTVTNTDELVILLANFTGTLTLEKDKAVYSKSDDTKVVFDLDGKKYEVVLTTSGKKETVKYVYEESWTSDGYWDESKDEYVSGTVNRISKLVVNVEVPEKVSFDLKEQGSSIVSVVLELDTDFSSEAVISKDAVSMTALIKYDDYEIEIVDAAYDGAKGTVSSAAVVRVDGKTLVSYVVSAEARVKEVTETWTDEYSGYEETWTEYSFEYAKNVEVNVNVLDQIQIKGVCENAENLYEFFENLDDADNQTQAQRAIDNINNAFKANLHYDGGNNAQATVEMELTAEDGWYWFEPVIVFNDGSRYAFYDYFTESSFSGLIDTLENIFNDYEDYFDNYNF